MDRRQGRDQAGSHGDCGGSLAGLSEIVDIAQRIYKAIQSAVRWMRKILEIVNSLFDSILQIVAGAIEPASEKIEAAMHRAMPVVISFLGNLGLGRNPRAGR